MGCVSASEQGTPQGGLVSPALANIYLHYVWMSGLRSASRESCRGKAYLVRYADDFVACFHLEEDAKRFLVELNHRLAAFDLEAEPTKTRLLRFGDQARAQCKREGLRRPQTFNFLGFTHFVGRTRRRTLRCGTPDQGERIRKKLKALNVRLAHCGRTEAKPWWRMSDATFRATSSISESVATAAACSSMCITPAGCCSNG